jgi:parallel beta-helix repeat protein
VDDSQYFGTYLYGSSSFTMGNVEFCENTLNCTYEGLYLTYAYEFGYEMFGNSNFLMGDFLVNENLINSADYEGIYAEYFDYWGNDMHDNSKFTMGNIEFSRNTINSKDDGIYVYELYEFGYYMYDNASFTMNNVLFNDNIIKSESYGISVDNCEYFGGDMHNSSSFSMGNIEFCRNVINSTSDAIGISSFIEFGTYMHGNSSFTMNSVLIKDNILHSYLWFSYFGTFGSYLYDTAMCAIESVEISGNTITSIGKAEDGITFYNLQPFGYDMHNYSLFMMGEFSVSNNSIVGDGDRFGVACTQISEFGTEIYDDASALMGNFEFADNDISFANQGFNLWMVRDAIIRDNTVWSCTYGIILPESSRNFICHNKFINNTVQASADLDYANTWDDGYPSGGNYWSEYIDVDEKQGPYQNLTGNDGIWDNPYIINANNTDHYPFSSLSDNQPPVIGIPQRTPSGDVSPSQEVTVTVSVTDSLNEVKNVTLYFTIDDGAHWNSTEMQKIPSTDLYEGVIPGQEAGTTVRFKIEAFDYADNNATRDGIEPYCIYQVIPEFGSLAIPSLLWIATLLAFALSRKKQQIQRHA